MTTIAANRRCMAADTKVTHGQATFYSPKIFVVGDSIVAAAGPSAEIAKFLAWLRAGKPADAPSLSQDDDGGMDALVLNRSGLYLYTDCGEPDQITDKCYAIGSGQQAALVAMRHFGSSPYDAVAAAAAVDNNTGGKITVVHLSDVPKARA